MVIVGLPILLDCSGSEHQVTVGSAGREGATLGCQHGSLRPLFVCLADCIADQPVLCLVKYYSGMCLVRLP